MHEQNYQTEAEKLIKQNQN